MATILQGTCSRSTISLTTEFGHWELPNDPEKQNTKSLSIFLRACCHPETGKPLCTYQQLADALGYKDRQDTNNFWRQFEASGKQFRDVLQRKMKVDDTVVDAVKAEVRQDLLASASTLCERVSQKLGRTDLTEANIRAALEKVPCTVVRQQIRAEWDAGAWHPKEQKLLEAIMQEWAERGSQRSESVLTQLDELGTQAPDQTCEEIVQVQQAEAVTSLFTPHAAMHAISAKMRLMAVALTRYYWNVPLSRIALWMGVSKTTTSQWVIGLAVALFPVVQSWISEGVKGVHLLIDEKWLKIRGRWWFWFVALDDKTGLPLLNRL